MIYLTTQTIDSQAVLASVQSAQAGAVVLFLGTTREYTGTRRTLSLDYECYAAMAEKKLAELEKIAREKWSLIGCTLVHRLGTVNLGEASVAVAVSSAHRAAAFEAGEWLIDTLKVEVPIWKREHWADGTTDWIHPGLLENEVQP
jgi:molybdopterin synthase catalytic subunit